MYKLLLFDIDDTICDASTAYKLAKKECFKYLKKKYPLINEELFEMVYSQAREQINNELYNTASSHERFLYFQRMFEILGLPLNPSLLYEISELYWKVTVKNLKLFPNVKRTLKILKENNMRIGIVSDLVLNVQIAKLRRLGIDRYVDFIVTSQEANEEMPSKKMFLLAMKKGDAKPEETIIIGDSINKDVIGAKNLGITSVWKPYKETQKEIKKKGKIADYVVNDFSQLLKIMKVKKMKFRKGKMLAFDLVGTLLKEGSIVKRGLYPLAKKENLNISYQELKDLYVKYSLGEIGKEEFNKYVPEEIEKKFLDSLELESSAISTLNYLTRKGYKLSILSNFPKEWGDYIVNKFNFQRWFSPIVFSGEYKTRKPDERLYLILAEKARIKPENYYLIDDKLENLKEARFLLMKTIHVSINDNDKKDILFLPDYRIKKLSDLKKLF
ncbi:MAG: HAD-IA family hydrolase [Candidatus Micrarchaeia archaeon]